MASTVALTPPPLPQTQAQQQQQQPGIPLHSLPEYFFVTHSANIIRFYKRRLVGNKITCCLIPGGEVVFEENIIHRRIRIMNPTGVGGGSCDYNTYRIGNIHLSNEKSYPLYSFHSSLQLPIGLANTFKKRRNELMPNVINSTSILNKIQLMGEWPDATLQSQQAYSTYEPAYQTQQPKLTSTPLPPSYVCNLLIEDAIKKEEQCPILYESLTCDNTVVTSCFHVFSREGFAAWRKKSTECPKCRAQCLVTV